MQRKIVISMVLIFVLLTAICSAQDNWILVDKEADGRLTYVNLDSIEFAKSDPNVVRFIVGEQNPANLYSMLLKINQPQWTYYEWAEFGPGDKIVGFSKPQLDWSNYDPNWPLPKAVLSHLPSQTSQNSLPTDNTSGGILLYNGALKGTGWKLENPEAGVKLPAQKVVISGITTGEMDISGDAWIHVRTNMYRSVNIDVLSKQHGDNQYNTYRTYQLVLSYDGKRAVYDLPTKQGLVNGDLTRVPGQVEVSLDGHTIVADLVVNGASVCRLTANDSEVTSLSGLVASMGASGNMQIYK